jgi:hypothetical protein
VMTTQPETITQSRVIICEGKADQAFFSAFIINRKITGVQVIRNFGGLSDNNIEKRLDEIEVQVLTGAIKSILLVIDSDSDANANFEKAVKQIKKTGRYGVPTEFKKPKRKVGRPKIGLLSIPDGEIGCLETLLLQVMMKMPQYVKTSKCAKDFYKCSGIKTTNISKESKMKMNALIIASCKDSPECRVVEMWQDKKGFREILKDNGFNSLEVFLRKFAKW